MVEVFGDVQRIGRRAAQHLRSEVLQEHHLARGVAPRHRHDRAAQPLGPVVQPQPAGEQPVAIGVMYHIVWPHAARRQRPGAALGPGADVALGVAHHGRLAPRARRGMEPHHPAERLGKQAEGIVVAQVAFAGEGEAAQIVQAVQIAGVHPCRVELLPVERHPLVHRRQPQPQPLRLHLLESFAGHRLDFRVPEHHRLLSGGWGLGVGDWGQGSGISCLFSIPQKPPIIADHGCCQIRV